MFRTLNVDDILFIDVETVRHKNHYSELDVRSLKIWIEKCKGIDSTANLNPLLENDIQKLYESHASFYPEFSKIICISIGYINKNEFRIKSFYNDNEKLLLKEFRDTIDKTTRKLIAHNGFGFDYPVITKRCLINGLNPPKSLHTFNKKPWEVELYDTMDLWKGIAKYGQTASLETIANVFNLPSPKTELNGSMVADYYFSNKLESIVKYCENDILTLKNIILKLKNLE